MPHSHFATRRAPWRIALVALWPASLAPGVVGPVAGQSREAHGVTIHGLINRVSDRFLERASRDPGRHGAEGVSPPPPPALPEQPATSRSKPTLSKPAQKLAFPVMGSSPLDKT